MDTKTLIVDLIRQDMKHNQLILGLEKLGISGDYHHNLEIVNIVAQLMGIVQGNIRDEWCDVYFSYIHEAGKYDIEPKGENLRQLAEACYDNLCEMLENA